MIEMLKYNTTFRMYDSTDEMIQCCLKGMETSDWKTGKTDLRFWEDSEFLGREFKSLEHLKTSPYAGNWELLDELYPVMRKQIEDGLHDLSVRVVRRQRQKSEHDGEFNVERFMDGDCAFYDSMHRTTAMSKTNQVIPLVYAPGYRWALSSREVLYHTIAFACLVDILEQSGFNVEIYLATIPQEMLDDGTDGFIVTRVKKSEQVLNVKTLMDITAPWFFRSFTFASFHTFQTQAKVGYGRWPYEYKQKTWNKWMADVEIRSFFDIPDNWIYFSSEVNFNYESALSEARSILSQFQTD